MGTISILFICGPLTLLNRLKYLKYSSIIGIVATFITVIYIDFTFFDHLIVNESVKMVQHHGQKTVFYWLESFNVVSSTFFGHFNASSLYGELRNATVYKMKRITFFTFIVIAIFLLSMAVPA